jgi:hypothetical protein
MTRGRMPELHQALVRSCVGQSIRFIETSSAMRDSLAKIDDPAKRSQKSEITNQRRGHGADRPVCFNLNRSSKVIWYTVSDHPQASGNPALDSPNGDDEELD